MNPFASVAAALAVVALSAVTGCSAATTPSSSPQPRFILREQPAIGTITITVPSGWSGVPGNRLVYSAESDTGMEQYDGDLWIYGDACRWSTTTPDAPAATVDEIISALGSQASRAASAPAKITIDEHPGQSITLHVPADITVEQIGDNATFPDCDDGRFSMLTYGGAETNSEPQRYAQGPGQIDEVSVVDVDGVLVLFDLFYWPNTPQDVIDDMRSMVESATFGE